MRRPTNVFRAYRWYIRAMSRGFVDDMPDEPQCGWFKYRRVTGGPWVPVRIGIASVVDEFGELAEPEKTTCEVSGRRAPAEKVWPYCYGRPISRAEYDAIRALPTELMAATRVKADLSETPIRP